MISEKSVFLKSPNGHPAPGPVLRPVVPLYIMINLCHRGAHSYDFWAFGFRGPLASSMSSSGTSTPFGSAAPSLRPQLVLVFSHLFLLLKACHHAHAWWACRLSSLLLPGLSCFTGIFERLVLNRLCFYLDSKNLVSLARAGFKPSGSTVDQVLLSS